MAIYTVEIIGLVRVEADNEEQAEGYAQDQECWIDNDVSSIDVNWTAAEPIVLSEEDEEEEGEE